MASRHASREAGAMNSTTKPIPPRGGPVDLAARFDLPDGHVHHGEITVDQVFFHRPVAGYADYRTPVRNLYLCGASAHPGGGVTGVPGHNAAREILKDLRK